MLKQKHLKNIRIISAILVLALFVCGFTNILGTALIHRAGHLQFVPALLAATTGLVVPLVGLLVVSLLFGRVYCSFLCPTGILQDAVGRMDRLFRKKKMKFRTEKPHTIARYTILGATVIAWIVGFNAVLTLLDPYGAFGRVGANILRPIAAAGNNLLALIFNAFGDYTFYTIDVQIVSVASLVVAIVTLAVIVPLALRRGRYYCNVICPVGTLLGLISKVSLFKIRVDETACNKCLLCATKCKSGCIDSKSGVIDYSRCVACYNCIPVCNSKALKVQWAFKKSSAKNASAVDTSKREALATGLAVAMTATLSACTSKATAAPKEAHELPIMPPGAADSKHFLAHCTACHLCVAKCPSQCIKPAFLEYGWAGVLQPTMKYSVGSYCNYGCMVCMDTCPTGALRPMPLSEKRKLQIGVAVFDPTHCVVSTSGTDCGACSEHCPTQAVHMVPYKDGLRIPQVDESLCVGCGGCQSICPVRPTTAIVVKGVAVQKHLNIAQEEQAEEEVVSDFGF
ncbi:ferredoxin [Bacteroidia bacterium]|nr:ferredoxin [Bacteroidia bacterium]